MYKNINITRIKKKVADLWLSQGTIVWDCDGNENRYFTDQFGRSYYYKIAEKE